MKLTEKEIAQIASVIHRSISGNAKANAVQVLMTGMNGTVVTYVHTYPRLDKTQRVKRHVAFIRPNGTISWDMIAS